MTRKQSSILALATAYLLGLAIASAQEKKEAPKGADNQPKQVINGKLTGFDMPADWKLSDRAKNLTYTNPANQNLAARWVNGEIVYRISVGEVKVDPKTTKVAKEYLLVYSEPKPGEPPSKAERVPDQLAIYDSKPGDEGYSPIWHYHYVIVPRDYKANTFRTEKQVQESGYKVVPFDYFSN